MKLMKGKPMSSKHHAGAALAAAVSAVLACGSMASAQQIAPQPTTQSAPAEIQQVQGRILELRQVPIRGVNAQNTLALIRTPQGTKVVVDLGDRLYDIELRRGQLLQARGRVVDIANQRPILLADAFRYAGLTYDANRVALRETGAAVAHGSPARDAPGTAGSAKQSPAGTAADAKPDGGTAAAAAAEAKTGTGTSNSTAEAGADKPAPAARTVIEYKPVPVDSKPAGDAVSGGGAKPDQASDKTKP